MEDYKDKKFKIRLEARLKNAELIRARESLGLNQKQAAYLIEISPGSLSHYELLRTYPSEEMQEKICSKYAHFGYHMIKKNVFPKQLKKITLTEKLIAEREIPVEKLLPLSQVSEKLLPAVKPEVLDKLYKEELKCVIEESLSTLTDKEGEVIKLYYGIDKDKIYTLEEIASKFNLTRERIRQIKEKAIKRLKHPSRADKLKDFAED